MQNEDWRVKEKKLPRAASEERGKSREQKFGKLES
jgi:hypothetical protein